MEARRGPSSAPAENNPAGRRRAIEIEIEAAISSPLTLGCDKHGSIAREAVLEPPDVRVSALARGSRHGARRPLIASAYEPVEWRFGAGEAASHGAGRALGYASRIAVSIDVFARATCVWDVVRADADSPIGGNEKASGMGGWRSWEDLEGAE